jgi:hypothetical protein
MSEAMTETKGTNGDSTLGTIEAETTNLARSRLP